MKTVYIYPGIFSPPTFGHLNIVRQTAAIVPELIVLCSKNPEKPDPWFAPEECKILWLTYSLPKNVSLMTLTEFLRLQIKAEQIVIVRGLRRVEEFSYEAAVMRLNKERFNLRKYLYVFSQKKYRDISSSKTRLMASTLDLENLSQCVSPLTISALLEKTLDVQNIFLVVGKPGAGKSTILKKLSRMSKRNHWINTDNFNQKLKPLLKEKFGEKDLIEVALKDEKELKKIIGPAWIKLLKNSLLTAPRRANVFIEIAYGLQKDKLMFRFVGGKIIYIGCDNETDNYNRVVKRGTPKLTAFIKKIPGQQETEKLAKKYGLSVSYIGTDCTLQELFKKTKQLNTLLKEV
ncbi:adenylyltransferase/cytidyltransferase family protein [Candidatus Falkowbacteria bacterium]|nr:MAG: adenylyltransferase/cytidyltransferase family protein [Candidatus Falkowbacteria bacterium]